MSASMAPMVPPTLRALPSIRVLKVAAAALSLLLASTNAPGARVFYVNQPEGGLGEINAVSPDGTGHTTLHTTSVVTDLRGIAVDSQGGRLFYAHADIDAGQVRRQVSIRTIPTAGGSPVTLATLPDGTFMADVEWDELNGNVYFAQTGTQQIRRMKPDGSELATIITTIGDGLAPYFFGLDPAAGMAYWGIGTDSGDTNTPYSRGSIVTGLIDPNFTLITPSRTRDIAIDRSVPGGRVYWCDRQNGAVYVRSIEGGDVSVARSGLNAPHGLVLDLDAGKGYMADTGKRGSGSQPSARRVVRFNLNGTGELEFLSPASGVAEPWDLTIDLKTTNYADWKTRFFSATADLTDAEHDADGDGMPNYAEYAFFTHPDRPDASQQPVSVDGRKLRFPRRRVTDIPVRIEVSTDLQTWRWNGDSSGSIWTVETATSFRDADSEWVTVEPAPSLAGAGNLYYRVYAQAPQQARTNLRTGRGSTAWPRANRAKRLLQRQR
jgi:DNA-binding beta-propeller fold protein YncE